MLEAIRSHLTELTFDVVLFILLRGVLYGTIMVALRVLYVEYIKPIRTFPYEVQEERRLKKELWAEQNLLAVAEGRLRALKEYTKETLKGKSNV